MRVDGLSIKPGPTESGNSGTNHVLRLGPPAVGGELLPANFWLMPKHLILILILLIPLGLILYKKRDLASNLLTKLILR